LVFDNESQGMNTTVIQDHETVAPLWTTKDLAKFLGCSERQIPRLREEGLPAVRVGGLIRFIPARVMTWLDSRDERASQLADIAASGDEDNADCAAADHFREFPPLL
jgi:excisionase family DNA binding protein